MRLGASIFWLAIMCPLVSFARSGSPAEDASRATVRIHQGPKSGTGFLVAIFEPAGDGRRHLLVTAAHVLEEMPEPTCTVVFRAPDAERGFVRKELSLTIREGKTPLWVRHPDVDVAVIALELPADVDVKPFAFRQIADAKIAEDGKIVVGQDVWIACYPTQAEANPAGWPILRRGSIATHPLTPLEQAKTLFVDYSHFGGDSGAAVVAAVDHEPMVVGLVFAMLRETDKVTTPFEERTVHTSLGLAIAVQSPFIRQTIEAWRKTAEAAPPP